jgi:hypothetical protein
MEAVACPYMVYMPEKGQLLMTLGVGWPYKAAVTASTDRGATWSEPRFLRVDEQGKPNLSWLISLTYLGNGVATAGFESQPQKWISRDYGVTWAEWDKSPPASTGTPFYYWDPILVDRDRKTGKVTRLTLAQYRQEDPKQEYSSQGYLCFSTDEGQTWSEQKKVPEWRAVNEIALVRAKNGDLVAACRTDNPDRYKGDIDHYCGLAVSVSRDNGLTWSPLNRLFEYGRHHPSMAVRHNGDMVMSYVVREGYPAAADGYPQFGVEAVVSRDHGKTWDLDHRYILASYKGNRTGTSWWHPSSQSTSTVVLPDDTILTAFSIGHQPAHQNRTVGLVEWRLNRRHLKRDRTFTEAPWDSELRNKLDPAPLTIDK